MQIFGYEIGIKRATQAPAQEQRGLTLTDPSLLAYFGVDPSQFHTGSANNNGVLSIPPAWAAIRYISEGIASLNRGVFYRESDGDVFPDNSSAVAQLLGSRPHPHYTTFDFLQALVTNACLGNGYAIVWRDGATTRPVALEIVPQEYVTLKFSSNGQLFYHVCGTINERPVNILLPETDMIHVKGVTMTGVAGRRVTLVHSSSFDTALGAQQYSNTWFEKGASVGGLITYPNPLSKEQREALRGKLETQHAGSRNAGSFMVLDAGADFKAVQAGPKDAAVVDFSNLTTIHVSQIFKVPLHLLSQLDRSTFSNMEQQNQDFVVHCLGPWARKIEEEITSKCFTTSEVRNRRRFFAFDLSPLQMGDMVSQATFFASAIQNGWMTPNEVRGKKNLNRIEGGDQLFIQQNMAPMDMLAEILEGKNKQTETPQSEGEAEKDTDDEPEESATA